MGTNSERTGARKMVERTDTVVIGGGQSGLSVGYHLKRQGVPFVILDASERIGDAWRKRWDSLRLFSTARYSGLDGLPFPAHAQASVTKDAMADYLEDYAEHFELPVRSGVRVERLLGSCARHGWHGRRLLVLRRDRRSGHLGTRVHRGLLRSHHVRR